MNRPSTSRPLPRLALLAALLPSLMLLLAIEWLLLPGNPMKKPGRHAL